MVNLPAAIAAAFDGHALGDKTGVSALLSSIGPDGWPHLSFLSVGEVVIAGTHIALTLWPKSATVAALTLQRRGVLFAAADGAVFEIPLTVADVRHENQAPVAIILGEIVGAREHRAPYADVSALIDFALHDPDATIERWQKQVSAMTAALGRSSKDSQTFLDGAAET